MKQLTLTFLLFFLFTKVCALPEGFVYLKDIDPTIISDLRYSKDFNFLGSPSLGYSAESKVILTKEAAIALKEAQQRFRKDGYCLVVYDAYRPQKAVDQFMRWSKDIKDQKKKAEFYPRVEKARGFELGYVAEKSGHSRGSTVDLTLIPCGQPLREITIEKRKLKDGFEILYLNDGTVDMGSSFDLFDLASHYENDLIRSPYKERRKYLKEIMEASGFKNYAEEWWHFTLKDEPYPDTYFNFDVK